MRHVLYISDCRLVLRKLPTSSIHACVTDPPYELGFMGKAWDRSGVAYDVGLWREVLRVLKPGAHLLAFGGTRTYHRLASAIQDAGFEIRDSIHWSYNTGFPKSRDIAKEIDKLVGAEREVVGRHSRNGLPPQFMWGVEAGQQWDVTAPATGAAKGWEGYGTGLRPAHEPIVLARKPPEGTTTQNALVHGAGGINVDGCREEDGRWPGNLWLFPCPKASRAEKDAGCEHLPALTRDDITGRKPGSAGSLNPRAGVTHRGQLHNAHPTCKPLQLMRWLVRLVCPPGAVVLDPFAGSGTTGCATALEGFGSILIEKETFYERLIEARVTHHGGVIVMARKISVFYCNSKGQEEGEIKRDCQAIAACISVRHGQVFPGEECYVTVTSGLRDFRAWEQKHGKVDWTAWIEDVVNGRDGVTGKRRYDLFVVKHHNVGKATASILRQAQLAGRKVLLWNGARTDWPVGTPKPKMTAIQSVECVDPNDYVSGWQVEPQGGGA